MRIFIYIKTLSFKNKVTYLIGKLIDSLTGGLGSYKKLKYQQSILSQAESYGGIISKKGSHYLIENKDSCLFLRSGTSDFMAYDQIFFKNEYKGVVEFWKQNIKSDLKLILDIGANVGFSSIYFAQHFPQAKIIAFEPDIGNFNLLSKNLKYLSNCFCENKAIWSHHTRLAITDSFRDHLPWSLSVTENLDVKSIGQTEAMDFKAIIDEYKINSIDLLKIDIEGAEGKILSERANLDFLNIVKVLALEIHDEVCDREYILILLRKYDFILFEIGETTLAVKRSILSRD